MIGKSVVALLSLVVAVLCFGVVLAQAVQPESLTVGEPEVTSPSGVVTVTGTAGKTGMHDPSAQSISVNGSSAVPDPAEADVSVGAGEIKTQITPKETDWHNIKVEAKSNGKEFLWVLLKVVFPADSNASYNVTWGPGELSGAMEWEGLIHVPLTASGGVAQLNAWWHGAFHPSFPPTAGMGGGRTAVVPTGGTWDISKGGVQSYPITEAGAVSATTGSVEFDVHAPGGHVDGEPLTKVVAFGMEVVNKLTIAAEGGPGDVACYTQTEQWFIGTWTWPVAIEQVP